MLGVNSLNDEEILAFFGLVPIPQEVDPLDLEDFFATLAGLLHRTQST